MFSRNFRTIVVAGGCYWGVEEYYRRLKGIMDTRAGFAQGFVENPTYEEVCTQTTGHTEAVLLTYNPLVITREQIIEHLFRFIDPTSLNKQGNDIGTQYRTGIYTTHSDDLEHVEAWVQAHTKDYTLPIVVEVEPLKNFFPAPEDHQLYLIKNPNGYCHVNFNVIKPEEMK